VTPADLLSRELGRDGARPLLTWYDDSEPARVELSVATTANWVAKIAGLLVDDYDVEPGVAVSIDLPLHWQTACVLLAVWSCGGCVALDSTGDLTVGTSTASDVVVHPDPMGVALSRLVASQPDHFTPVLPVAGDLAALRSGGREWTHDALGDAATHAATHHLLDRTARVLSTMGLDSVDGIDAGLLAPLAAGASVVLVSNADTGLLTQRCATEHVTHTAGVAVPDVVRLD
jgi:uncharacterized protein (TIGR03089 family)